MPSTTRTSSLALALCLVALLLMVSLIIAPLSSARAGEISEGAGVVTGGSAGSNVAAVSATGAGQAFLIDWGKIILAVRYALELPAESVASQVSSHLTGLIGTIGSFAVKATVDDDSRAGIQTLIEIHRVDTVTGIKAGSAGHYARSAGFTNAEFAELIGWSE